jgi:hypothetical protein
MKEMKPRFELSRVYSDGTKEPAHIVPLSEALKAKMNRRGFFGAGITAAVAVLLLDGCDKDDPEPYKRVQGCTNVYAHDDSIDVLAVSPDGKWLFSGSYKTVKMWSLPEGAFVKALIGHSNTVYSLTVSPDGKLLFSGSDDTIRIWRLPEGTLVKTLRDTGYAYSLAVSLDGKRLFSGSYNAIKIWSLPEGTLEKTLTGGISFVESLVVSSDGKRLFSGSSNTVKIWNLPEDTLEKTLTIGRSGSGITSLAISSDEKRLFFGSSDNTVTIWRLPEGTLEKTLTGSSSSLAVSPDETWLASLNDSSIRLWSLPDFVLKKEISVDLHSLRVMILSVDGQRLISGEAGKLQLRRLPELTVDKCLLDLNCVEDTVEGVTYSVMDESGRVVTYTLPCGSSIPKDAKCICDCVPGKICSCNPQCTCDSQCSCNSQCTCQSHNATCSCHYVNGCSCNKICTCNQVCTCLAV